MTESPPATDAAAGQRAVAQNVQALAAFLQQHAPFDAMEPAHVLHLLQHSALVFFAAGQQILGPEAPRVAHWYIVRQGHVVGQRAELAQPAQQQEPADEREYGFPFRARLSHIANAFGEIAQREQVPLGVDFAAR